MDVKEFLARGQKRQNNGNLDGAMDDFCEAIKLDPACLAAYIFRGGIKVEKGQFDAAIADYNKVLELDPTSAEAYILRGKAKVEQGDIEGATADYKKSVDILSPDAASNGYTADSNRVKCSSNSAIADCVGPRRLASAISNALLSRGVDKQDKGDLDGAIDDYSCAARFDPFSAIAYYNRGKARRVVGELKGAIADFTEVLRFDPKKSSRTYCWRASVKGEAGDMDGAIEDATLAIAQDATNDTAYSIRGGAKRSKGDTNGAIEDCNVAIKLNRYNARAFNHRGAAKQDIGEYHDAIVDYDQAIEIEANYASAYNNRGTSKAIINDKNGAEKDYLEALKINPQFAAAHNNLGNLRMYSGNVSEAIKHWKKALKYKETLKSMHPNLAILSVAMTHGLNDLTCMTLLQLYERVFELLKRQAYTKQHVIMHYTDLRTLRNLANGASFRLYDSTNRDDSTEGKIFPRRVLEHIPRKKKKEINKFFTVSPDIFIGSFATNSNILYGDSMMWGLYGKDEGVPGAGCALVFESNEFTNIVSNMFDVLMERQSSKENRSTSEYSKFEVLWQECCLFNVVYDVRAHSDLIRNIADTLLKLGEFADNDDVRNLVSSILDYARFLFKDVEYEIESEARLVIWRPVDNDGSGIVKTEYPKTFVECPRNLFPKRVLLGANVKNSKGWKRWLKAQFSSLHRKVKTIVKSK